MISSFVIIPQIIEFGSTTKHGKDSFGCWEVGSSSPADTVLDLSFYLINRPPVKYDPGICLRLSSK